jgi:hypothetical protein
MYADDGIDRSWFAPIPEPDWPDAPIWKAMKGGNPSIGFGVWRAPKKRGVYIWQAPTESPRAFGTRSDIAYIGRAAEGQRGNLAHRLRYHELRWFDLDVTWRTCWSYAEAEQLEDELLRLYRSIHGQLPPYNRRNAARRRPSWTRRSRPRSYARA